MMLLTFERRRLLLLTLTALLLPAPPSLAEDNPGPDSPRFGAYVMNRVDDLYRGDKSHGQMEMRIKTRHWTRTLGMESWSLGKDYSLVRIRKPRKERGTATLKAKRDLFIYLNRTGRTIKITSGMLGGSWMGSHFTNDDLIRQTRMSKDYTIKLAFRGTEKGVKVYRFVCKARPDAAVVWDKVVATIRQADLQPLHQEFYDEDGKKQRVMEFSGHKQLGGRVLPTVMLMKPLDQPGEFTRVSVKEIDFDVKLDRSFFSLHRLKTR